MIGWCTRGWIITWLELVEFQPRDDLPAGRGICSRCRALSTCSFIEKGNPS
jgi:hypothetical protein